MVTVIKYPHEKNKKCACGCTLRYSPATDIRIEKNINGTKQYIICPVCKKKVILKTVSAVERSMFLNER